MTVSLHMTRPFLKRVTLLVLLLAAPAWTTAARAQCVDSSTVNNFRVRSVRFQSLFGRTPKRLRQTLDSHRGEPYSAARAAQYIDEIVKFRSTDPAQQKYERLIANKLKVSVKGGKTELECVRKVAPAECQAAFPGTDECVDVIIRRYFVEVDALNSSPYLLLFPRSALAALYGAIPRPLLALNPALDANQDKRFGFSVGIDTATDLLDLRQVFEKAEPSPSPVTGAAPHAPAAPPSGGPPDNLEVTFTTPGGGSSPGAEAAADSASDLEPSDTKLLLRLKGRKSLTKDFYDTSVGLKLARTQPLKLFQNLALEARFDARNLPQGDGSFFRNAATFGLSTDIRLKSGPMKLINLGGNYRWSRNRFFGGAATAGEFNSENGFETRAIADGNIARGLARAGLWFDGGALDGDRGSYKRLAALFGYGKEFVIPRKKEFRKISPPELGGRECWTSYPEDPKRNEPTIGVEILAGAGRAWGALPEYARFYGGNPPGQFLYDEVSVQGAAAFPAGPVLRSVGQREAAIGRSSSGALLGGASYWHGNVNVSIPVSAWSRPLIPHEWVTISPLRAEDTEFRGRVPDGSPICRDLKSTIKTLVRVSSINLLVNQQARDELTEEEKAALRLRNKQPRTPEEQSRLDAAEAAFSDAKSRLRPQIEDLFSREILPITDFIADHANIISVKPLVMFDVAHLGPSGGSGGRTHYGAGGGLQVDVVLARFEFGYLAGFNRAPGDPRGHLVGRLILRRFF